MTFFGIEHPVISAVNTQYFTLTHNPYQFQWETVKNSRKKKCESNNHEISGNYYDVRKTYSVIAVETRYG